MILMWLGSFALVLWAMAESQKSFPLLTLKLQRKIFDKGFDGSTVKSFFQIGQVTMLEASSQRSLYGGMSLYNMRVLSMKAATLMMCLSTIGAWWVLVLSFLFMKVNGYFVIGLGSILLVSFFRERFGNLFRLFFFSGLFLVGAELSLQHSRFLPMALGQDLAFFLADGRFVAIGILFVVAAAVSVILEIEFWSLALGLLLMATKMLSFNGALALLAGERIGRILLFWWRTRNLNQDCQRLGKSFSLTSALGVVIGFLSVGFIRESMSYSLSSMDFSMADRVSLFLVLFILMLSCQMFAQLVWGHFASRTKVDELQDPKYFDSSWIAKDLISPAALLWAKSKIQQRLNEIKYHLHGLSTVKAGQIPEVIQARLKQEEEQLAKTLSHMS